MEPSEQEYGNVRPENVKEISAGQWIASCEYCGAAFEGGSYEKGAIMLATHIHENHEHPVDIA